MALSALSSGRSAPVRDEAPSQAVFHPSFGRLVNFQVTARADGDEQATAQTIALMMEYAKRASVSPAIQAAAEIATQGARLESDKVRGIFAWVKRRVRFIEDDEAAAPLASLGIDPHQAEVVIYPPDLLAMPAPAGDCDDHATLTAALLLASGITPEFVTIAAEAGNPDYSHVYTRARLSPSRAIALDTSHGSVAGWEATPTGKTRIWRFDLMPQQPCLGAVAPWVQDLIKTGATTTAEIFKERYGQAPEGTYKQTAEGSIYYRQPANAGALTFPGASLNVPTSGSTLLLIAGVAVLAIVLLKPGR